MANIAARNEDGWFPLGSGIGGEDWAWLHSLHSSEGHLLVGGQFESAGGVSGRNFAIWDGEHWLEDPGGNSPDPSSEIYVISEKPGCVFVGGNFRQLGNVQVDNLGCLTHSDWRDVAGGTSGAVYTAGLVQMRPVHWCGTWVRWGLTGGGFLTRMKIIY